MTHAQSNLARTQSASKATAKSADDDITLYSHAKKRDAAKLARDMGLPVGASVAIVPSDAHVGKKLRQLGFIPFNRLRRFTENVSEGANAQRESRQNAVVDKSAFEPDARSRALLMGVKMAQEDLRNAGGSYDLESVRALMRGISRQRIDRRVREGSLLAVSGPSNRRRYPTVQFAHDGAVVEGLKEVQDALPTRNAWSVLNFLVNPESRLGGRKPIDLLKAGEIESVVEAARRIGQQGA